jgi:hypothetical protein
MKKIVWVNGLIAGAIVTAMMLFSTYYHCVKGDFDNAEVYGYTSMILAFSFIFVGIKTYRDKYNNGTVSFGKAFLIGLFISLIASTCYVAAWQVDYHFFFPDFMDIYSARTIEKLKASGAGAAEIASKTKEMMEFKEMYKNPVFNVLITYVEILPLGILITLICSFILKRKQPKQA